MSQYALGLCLFLLVLVFCGLFALGVATATCQPGYKVVKGLWSFECVKTQERGEKSEKP